MLLIPSLATHMDLAPEGAIGEDEVDGGENHAENPPDEADGLAVLRGGGV